MRAHWPRKKRSTRRKRRQPIRAGHVGDALANGLLVLRRRRAHWLLSPSGCGLIGRGDGGGGARKPDLGCSAAASPQGARRDGAAGAAGRAAVRRGAAGLRPGRHRSVWAGRAVVSLGRAGRGGGGAGPAGAVGGRSCRRRDGGRCLPRAAGLGPCPGGPQRLRPRTARGPVGPTRASAEGSEQPSSPAQLLVAIAGEGPQPLLPSAPSAGQAFGWWAI